MDGKKKMAFNVETNFWLIIAGLYGALAIVTPIISYFANKYVDEWTEGSSWVRKYKSGKEIEIPFFKPITRYLTWMMVIDMVVFIIAVIVALKSAGIW